MLNITVQIEESFNQKTNEFSLPFTFDLQLEHSLVSLSKWESFFKKPFLTNKDKTPEEMFWYIQAMAVTPNVPPEVFQNLSSDNIDAIQSYISDKMTATWFSDKVEPVKAQQQVITSELIYYWMISMQIPVEFEHWHLNRLLTLIRVCNEKNKPEKKMSKREMASRRRELNEQRLKQYGTSG